MRRKPESGCLSLPIGSCDSLRRPFRINWDANRLTRTGPPLLFHSQLTHIPRPQEHDNRPNDQSQPKHTAYHTANNRLLVRRLRSTATRRRGCSRGTVRSGRGGLGGSRGEPCGGAGGSSEFCNGCREIMSYLSSKGGLCRERDISGDVVAEESRYVWRRECYGVAEEIDARCAN
jgi:hypothetical protein